MFKLPMQEFQRATLNAIVPRKAETQVAQRAERAAQTQVRGAVVTSGRDVALFSTAAREAALQQAASKSAHQIASDSLTKLSELSAQHAAAPTAAAKQSLADQMLDRFTRDLAQLKRTFSAGADQATKTLQKSNPEALKAARQLGDLRPAQAVLSPEAFRALKLHEFVTDQLHRTDVFAADLKRGDTSRMIHTLNFILTA